MAQFTAKIIDPVGIHARPATELTRVASTFKSDIKIISKKDGRSGNAKSIMNIMALGIKTNDEVIIEAIGEDENEAIETIKSELSKIKLFEI